MGSSVRPSSVAPQGEMPRFPFRGADCHLTRSSIPAQTLVEETLVGGGVEWAEVEVRMPQDVPEARAFARSLWTRRTIGPKLT
jgi:hypothetical protein